jgi:transposase
VVCRALACTQKKAQQEGRTVVWVDEAGFYLLAGVVRTYAPRGQTPIIHVPLTRDHLSVISGLTEQGQLLVQMQARAFKGADVVHFLKHLLCHIGGKLLIIWDGAPIHRDKAIKAFLAMDAAERLWLEQVPGYAPELNPDEGVWDHLKNVELRNVACHDQDELRHELRLAIARLRHRPALIRSFIRHYGY